MLKKILIALIVAVAGLMAYAATRPDTYEVSRSIELAAPPARVHALVNDFHHFPQWSPWQKLDPAMQTSFDGPDAGVGAKYAWQGNKDVGKGSMAIIESIPGRKVGMDLEFIEPFASKARTDIDIEPTASGSKVTWSMRGDNNFISKLMSVFVSMDAMIGKDFEESLANLKRISESAN
ncbi:SRPBCC family protein [Solilutibacter tolerans]|uniref:Polyketide cyclase / dehydrase and lipid transport n=1 Tax=Solilutibacter tolerans TaxID=1604334 RepID=A0A1N6XIE1_9GAMM|nr:SRPBCC family protein [Lysobacter tolerans]SIR02156.1 Polyketide cyclase / dehydrase and lipid transport [Lysobacter tolerans]